MAHTTIQYKGKYYRIWEKASAAIFEWDDFRYVMDYWNVYPNVLWKFCDSIGLERCYAEIGEIIQYVKHVEGTDKEKDLPGRYLWKRLNNLSNRMSLMSA